MARRRTHLIVGATSGAAVAAYSAREQNPWNALAEAFGGGVGGALGSAAPDMVEPAFHSWHRSFAHSYTAAVGGTIALRRAVPSWQHRCRAEAARHEHLAQICVDAWSRFWHGVAAFLWRMAAGFAVGVAAGYVSHLALDVGTPRGLPLLA